MHRQRLSASACCKCVALICSARRSSLIPSPGRQGPQLPHALLNLTIAGIHLLAASPMSAQHAAPTHALQHSAGYLVADARHRCSDLFQFLRPAWLRRCWHRVELQQAPFNLSVHLPEPGAALAPDICATTADGFRVEVEGLRIGVEGFEKKGLG